MAEENNANKVNLSDPEHIECPYKMYASLHEAGGVGVDPNIGTIVAGYDTLAALAKNTAAPCKSEVSPQRAAGIRLRISLLRSGSSCSA